MLGKYYKLGKEIFYISKERGEEYYLEFVNKGYNDWLHKDYIDGSIMITDRFKILSFEIKRLFYNLLG